ncbi:MAG: hypothetical protein US50_C0057G0004 [Candidatus Nomurabacteria bacterium GW2011_GWB1_37_5]|uniref:HD domain-containing protein n=1 Tax=Candidatus Nomurabacteria bacterium GW2011_GWB1_37_5 TaxID=1618742 RepID=A0A0G0JBR0_9BACT|nr:MAG: hypothetical protein US50_C0057G0004 [Candidatus Nomurabacteria bacterium GW2011_GWB1_37_5]
MFIHDRIYGVCEIKEPVVIELMRSAPIERLKKINQAGASQYLFSWKDVTRYEHSIGVMLLLKKYEASLEEQVAGLLHDIPHTAFSHVADFVFENEHHEYHERFHESIIKNSGILDILKKYDLSLNVAHPENFSLLERNIPDLCADRIDYALRDFYSWKKDKESIKAKLAGLTVYKGEFVFEDIYSAHAFARDYLELDKRIWADPRETALYELLAQAIRHALDKKILTGQDFFTDDATVLSILKTKGDAYIHKKLAYLSPSFRIEEATPHYYHLSIRTKTRYVDPKVLTQAKLFRLSELSNTFKKLLATHLKVKGKRWYINVFPY